MKVMYTDMVKTQDIALCHLFFHCCFKDGTLDESEKDYIAERFVEYGINKDVDFRREIVNYQSYRNAIDDEMAFLKHLFSFISPVNPLALYSYCLEICLSDGEFSINEECLLDKIASILEIPLIDRQVAKRIMIERTVTVTQKIY